MPNDQKIMRNWSREITKSPVLYPDERLTAMLKSYVSKYPVEGKIGLDIGFGSGRHLKLLSDLGFDTYGIDILEEAKNLVTEHFQNFPPEKIIIADYINYEFKNKFDAVILWGSIFLVPFSQLEQNLKQLKRIVNKDGRIFLNFRTTDNWFKGLGIELEPNTYLLDSRANEYEGFLYSLVSLDDLKSLIIKSDLKLEKIERVDLWKNDLKEQNSWFICEISHA